MMPSILMAVRSTVSPPGLTAGPFCRKGPPGTRNPVVRKLLADANVPLGKRDRPRCGFTLVELLVTISIISLLASIVLFAMAAAQEVARVDRTRAQIARIDALLAEKWDTYATRRLDVNVQPITNSPRQNLAIARVNGIRELMRMELPDRKSDLGFPEPGVADETAGPPVVLRRAPYLYGAYQRKALKLLREHYNRPNDNLVQLGPSWSPMHQGAECLYLILSQMTDDDASALQFFSDNEIADVDGDGMPEIVDAWGIPIGFLRWAPGFITVGGSQDGEAPDAFDPTGVYAERGTFALYPLVFSAGPDKQKDIFTDPFLVYTKVTPPNNPFFGVRGYQNAGYNAAGSTYDARGDGDNSIDNIHNHLLIAGT